MKTTWTFPPHVHLLSLTVIVPLLLVALASPTFAALQAVSTTANSVTLTWTAVGDDGTTGTAAVYDIRYSLTAITDANWATATKVINPPKPKTAGQVETCDISGLQPNTTYYFALKVGDEVPNWSGLSNVVLKKTLQETTPPAPVSNLTASAATASSVTLTWTAPGDDANTGIATSYDLRYATTAITDANWGTAIKVTGVPAPKSAGSAETFTVTGLTGNVTYYFAMKTADEVPNWSTLSNVASKATVGDVIRPANIANLGAGSETTNSVTLSWTAPGDDGNTGTAKGYAMRYATFAITDSNFASATPVSQSITPKPAGSAESFVVTGLSAGTTYYFSVKTVDDAGNWSDASNCPSRATSSTQTPPVAITNLAATGSTQSTVTLSWTAPGDNGTVGTAKTYVIRYSTKTITNANWDSAAVAPNAPAPHAAGTTETFTVTGLNPTTTYYFAVKTISNSGQWSNISNVATRATTVDATPPATINDLSLAPGPADGQLVLRWTAPGDDGMVGKALSYSIRYSTSALAAGDLSTADEYKNPPTPQVGGSSQKFTMKGLVPGQTYWVSLTATDRAGNTSAPSNLATGQARLIVVAGLDSELVAIISPKNNTALPTARPILTVANIIATTGSTYQFEVAADTAFASPVASGSVSEDPDGTTSWQVDQPLQPRRTYYWRARAEGYEYCATSSFLVTPYAHPYPNPFRPAEVSVATFADLPAGADLVLLSPSGETVRSWNNVAGQVTWDGTNASGDRVASGAYLWYLADSDVKGKIIVLR